MWWTAIRIGASLLALASFAYYAIALIAAWRFFERGVPVGAVSDGSSPPLSLLKPIYGLDRETYENYASFCRQDYPDYEILFCVSDVHDPAIDVIEKLIHDFPAQRIRLLIGSEPLGVSDKVNKLCRMAREARHDLLVVTDSDVRVEPGFLRAVAAPFNDASVGGVTCLYKGLTDGSLAADLEATGNSTDFAAGVLVAWLFAPVNFMLGAVMATTKERLTEIGGFEALVDFFSDDYELGNRIAKNERVELISFPVSIVYPQQSVGEAFRHQLRWCLSIRFSRPAGYVGLLFTQGLPLALIAALLSPKLTIAAAFIGTYLVLRYSVAFAIGLDGIRDDLIRRKFYLLPLRDAFAFVVWLSSFFPQTISWRGKRFRVRERKLVA
ncbi:MAG: bacteriohopanetetrol glucosamine biosynthesis glycosyltransferase HpnI [Candidatus Acidiferrales bacterium]